MGGVTNTQIARIQMPIFISFLNYLFSHSVCKQKNLKRPCSEQGTQGSSKDLCGI